MLHELDITTTKGRDIGVKRTLKDPILWVLRGNCNASKPTFEILYTQGSLWKKQSLDKLGGGGARLPALKLSQMGSW